MMNKADDKAPTAPEGETGGGTRNPRHLQWEMRFSQLQSFKAKYGHAQVPIGWDVNPQLANWVSKQRQEYKNLLRGRATRLDENRIRLLNSVNFAWQLQRGGRRRQLKAKDHRRNPKDGEKSSDSDTEEKPCILPGEVVIGQGSPTSAGVSQIKTAIRDAQRQRNQPVAKEAPPSLQHQQSLQQLSSAPTAPGMQYLNRTGAPLAVPNNDLLDYVLARNALMQNLQTPSALPMSRGYPQLQTSASTQRNSLLPVLAPQPSPLFPLTGSLGTPAPGPWSTAMTSSLLDSAPAGGRMGPGIRSSEDESRLIDGGTGDYKNLQHQQEQALERQYIGHQGLPAGSTGTGLHGVFDVTGTPNHSGQDQQAQGFTQH